MGWKGVFSAVGSYLHELSQRAYNRFVIWYEEVKKLK